MTGAEQAAFSRVQISWQCPRSEYPSRKLWDKSVRGKGNLGVQPIWATEPTSAMRKRLLAFVYKRSIVHVIRICKEPEKGKPGCRA